MPLELNIASIILIIAAIQGLYLGSVLVFGRTRRHPSTYLGVTLMVFSVGLIYDVIRHSGALISYPELYFLPIKLYYIPVPLTYLFVRKLTPVPLQLKDYLWLLPGIVEIFVLIILFVLPIEMKSTLETYNSDAIFYFKLYRHLWIPYSLLILYKCYGIVRENRARFLHFFSGSQDRLMRWILRSTILTAVFCCIFLAKFLVDDLTYDTYIFPVIATLILIFIFSIGTWGIKQSFVDFDYSEYIEYHPDPINPMSSKSVDSDKTETTGMLVLETLRMHIEKNRPYRDPELTVDTLAKSSKIPSRQISSSINQFANMNFNTFINQFRVDEAKRMLRDEQYSHLNILGIGFEVGFNSKATFHSVFKKQTGMTPARWQKESNTS